MRRATAALLAAIAVMLVTACGSDGGGDRPSAVATSETTTSAEPTSDAPAGDAPTTEAPTTGAPTTGIPEFPANTELQFAENSGEWDLVLRDVRVGEHENFDRIVLEFAGTGLPGWAVKYMKKAALDGSGQVVTLAGDANLVIFAHGILLVDRPGPEWDYYEGPGRFRPEHGGDVIEMRVGEGPFEGSQQVLVGIDGDPTPFRVFALSDPSRLVVDVVDDGAS